MNLGGATARDVVALMDLQTPEAVAEVKAKDAEIKQLREQLAAKAKKGNGP